MGNEVGGHAASGESREDDDNMDVRGDSKGQQFEWRAQEQASDSDKVRQGRLRWFGHVERKDAGEWVSACRDMVVAGQRGRGRGRKTWKECVADEMKKLRLKMKDAQDRAVWRVASWRNVQPVRARKEGRKSDDDDDDDDNNRCYMRSGKPRQKKISSP